MKRCLNRLKQYLALAARYEKPVVIYHALHTIAAMLVWLEGGRHP